MVGTPTPAAGAGAAAAGSAGTGTPQRPQSASSTLGFGPPVLEDGTKYYYFGGSGVDMHDFPTQLSAELNVGGEARFWESSSAIHSPPLVHVRRSKLQGSQGPNATPATTSTRRPHNKSGVSSPAGTPSAAAGGGWEGWGLRTPGDLGSSGRPTTPFSGGKPSLFELKKMKNSQEAKYLLKPATATTPPPSFSYEQKLGPSNYEALEAISAQLLDCLERMNGRVESLCSIFDFFKGSTFLHDLQLPPSFFQLLSGIGSVVKSAILADTPVHSTFCPTPLTPNTVANWLALRRQDYAECVTWETACKNGHDRDNLLSAANERMLKKSHSGQGTKRVGKAGLISGATLFLMRVVLNTWYALARRRVYARYRVLDRVRAMSDTDRKKNVFIAWRQSVHRNGMHVLKIENRRLHEGLVAAKNENGSLKTLLHDAVDQRSQIQTSHDELKQQADEVMRLERTRRVSSLIFDLTRPLEDEYGPIASGFIAFRRPDLVHASRGGVRLDSTAASPPAATPVSGPRGFAARGATRRGSHYPHAPDSRGDESSQGDRASTHPDADLETEPDFYTVWVERGAPLLREPGTPQYCLLLWAAQVLEAAPIYALPKPLRKRKLTNSMDDAEATGRNVGCPRPLLLEGLDELSVYAWAALLQQLYPNVVTPILAEVSMPLTWKEVVSVSDDEDEAAMRRRRMLGRTVDDGEGSPSGESSILMGVRAPPPARVRRRRQLAEAANKNHKRRLLPLEISQAEQDPEAQRAVVVDYDPTRRDAVVAAVWDCLVALGFQEDLDRDKLLCARREDLQVKLLSKMLLHHVLVKYMPPEEQDAKALTAYTPIWQAPGSYDVGYLTLKAALGVPYYPRNANIPVGVFGKSALELSETGVGGEDSRLLSVVLLWASGVLQQSQGYRSQRIIDTNDDKTSLDQLVKKMLQVQRTGSVASLKKATGRGAKKGDPRLGGLQKRAGKSNRSILWWKGVTNWKDIHPKFICTGWVGGFDQTLYKVCQLAQHVARPFQRQGVPLTIPMFPDGFDEEEREFICAEFLIKCLQAVNPNAPFPLTPDQLSSGLPDVVMLYLCALFLAVWQASQAAQGGGNGNEKPARGGSGGAAGKKKAQAEEERRAALAQLRAIATEKEDVTMALFRGAWSYIDALPPTCLPQGPAVPRQLAGRVYLLLTLHSSALKDCYVRYASDRLVEGGGGFDLEAARRLFTFLRTRIPEYEEPAANTSHTGKKDKERKESAPPTPAPGKDMEGKAPDLLSSMGGGTLAGTVGPSSAACVSRFTPLLRQLVAFGEIDDGFVPREPEAVHLEAVQAAVFSDEDLEQMFAAAMEDMTRPIAPMDDPHSAFKPEGPPRTLSGRSTASGPPAEKEGKDKPHSKSPPGAATGISMQPLALSDVKDSSTRGPSSARPLSHRDRLSSSHGDRGGAAMAIRSPVSSAPSSAGEDTFDAQQQQTKTLDISGFVALLVRWAKHLCVKMQETAAPSPSVSHQDAGSNASPMNVPAEAVRTTSDRMASRTRSGMRTVSGVGFRSRNVSVADAAVQQRATQQPSSIEEPCLVDDVVGMLGAICTRLPAEAAGKRATTLIGPPPSAAAPREGADANDPNATQDATSSPPTVMQQALALLGRSGDTATYPLPLAIHPFLGSLYSKPSQAVMQLVGPVLARVFVAFSHSSNASNQLEGRTMSMAQLQEFVETSGAFPKAVAEPQALQTLLKLVQLSGSLAVHVVLQELPLSSCVDTLAAVSAEEVDEAAAAAAAAAGPTIAFTTFSELIFATASVAVASPWLSPDEKLHHYVVHTLLPKVRENLPLCRC